MSIRERGREKQRKIEKEREGPVATSEPLTLAMSDPEYFNYISQEIPFYSLNLLLVYLLQLRIEQDAGVPADPSDTVPLEQSFSRSAILKRQYRLNHFKNLEIDLNVQQDCPSTFGKLQVNKASSFYLCNVSSIH